MNKKDKTRMSEEDAKLMYDIAKLTNVSRQITSDFVDTMVFAMFKDYISRSPNPILFLEAFMDNWEESMIIQKEIELEALTSPTGSMLDMAAGAIIANSENVEKYKEEVSSMKELLTYAIIGV